MLLKKTAIIPWKHSVFDFAEACKPVASRKGGECWSLVAWSKLNSKRHCDVAMQEPLPQLLTRPVRSLLCLPSAGREVGTVYRFWLLESNFVVELPVTSSSSQTQSKANYPAQPAVLWKLCETLSAARPDLGCAFAPDQALCVRKLKVLFGDRGPHLRVTIV